jgi:hypothetical protein
VTVTVTMIIARGTTAGRASYGGHVRINGPFHAADAS